MQYIVHEHNDNTIRFILRFPACPDAELLRQAAEAVIRRIDVLHASFHPERRGFWTVHDAFDCFRLVDAASDPVEAAMDLALEPVAPQSSAQLQLTLVKGQTVSCALVVRISHLVADGRDGLYLLRKIAEAYQMLLTEGSCEDLQVKNGSRAPQQIYNSLSRQEMRSLKRNPMTGVKTVFPFPSEEEGKPWMISCLIPAAAMNAAHRRARESNASINDVLLTALYRSLAVKFQPGDALSVMSMMDLRRHCPGGDSQGLCNLSGSLPTVLTEGVQGDFLRTLKEIAAQTEKHKQDPLAGLAGMPLLHGAIRRLPISVLMHVCSRVYGGMATGMTNLGSIRCDELALGNVKPDAGWFAGPVKRKPGLQVSAASFDGRCALCVAGCLTEADAPAVQALLSRMADEIEAFAQ